MDKPKIIEFAEYYDDDSGTEYAIRVDQGQRAIGGHSEGIIEFDHLGDPVAFPLEKLTWIIECLTYIKENMDLPPVRQVQGNSGESKDNGEDT